MQSTREKPDFSEVPVFMIRQRPRVYVAGPYTQGNMLENVRNAIDAGDRLASKGFAPYIPHLSHFWDLVHKHDYEFWLDICLTWVQACDAVLRLPGYCPGCEREVALAENCGIPIFENEELLYTYYEVG